MRGRWDDIYLKEEGIVIEFDFDSKTGKIKSLKDNNIYNIDSRELVRTKIELRPGDKVLFAPFEDSDGNDYARVIRIIDLKRKARVATVMGLQNKATFFGCRYAKFLPILRVTISSSSP
jgi:hypothetical protein